jgi:phosphorylase kinase alpha/beta subunit
MLRVPNENVPLVWAQSLYYMAGLVREGLLSPSEADPLGRRLGPARPR